MATISLPGLNSGLDTSSLIQQLLMVESNQKTLLTKQQTELSKKQATLNDLKSRLAKFQTAAAALSDAKTLTGYSAASSDSDIISAEASYNAFEGNHTIKVSQLAAAERMVHTGKPYAEDLVGAGKFIYSYNHQETTITTTATTTLNDLVNLINNDPQNPGVTASLLNYDDGTGNNYHLVLSGNKSGADYTISVNAANTNVLASDSALTIAGANAPTDTKLRELDQFSGTLGTSDTITISGTKHDGTAITPVNLTITNQTTIDRLLSAITDAYGTEATAMIKDGKIQLTDTASGTSLTTLNLAFTADPAGSASLSLPTFSVGISGGSVSASLAGFEGGTFDVTQQAADALINVDGYPKDTVDLDGTHHTNYLSRESNTISDVIPGITLNLHAPTSGAGVQVSATRQTTDLTDKLNALVTAYNDVIGFIKDNSGYDAQTKVAGVLMGDRTVSDIRSLLRGPISTQASGFSKDSDTFLMPGQLGFALDKEGVLSLNSSTLSSALSKDYLGAIALVGAAKSGSSSSNAIKFYQASSNTSAGGYSVKANYAAGVLVSAQIKLDSEPDSAYRDAQVVENTIIGESSFDSNGKAVHPENGLTLSVDVPSGAGTLTATIQVKQGFAGHLTDLVKQVTNATKGMLHYDTQAVTDSIKQLQDRIDRETNRLTRYKSVLTDKFSRLEKTLALLQQQRSALGLN